MLFGPTGCTSSAPGGLGVVVLVVVVAVVVVVTPGMAAGFVGGTVGACVFEAVTLRKGAAGGSVGLAVIFGGPGKVKT